MSAEHRGRQPVEMPGANSLHGEITDLIRAKTLQPSVGGRARGFLHFKPTLTAEIPGEEGTRTVTVSAPKYPWVEASRDMDSYPHEIVYTLSDSQSGSNIEVAENTITSSGETADPSTLVERAKTLLAEVNKPEATITTRIDVENPNDVAYIQFVDQDGRINADVPRMRIGGGHFI